MKFSESLQLTRPNPVRFYRTLNKRSLHVTLHADIFTHLAPRPRTMRHPHRRLRFPAPQLRCPRCAFLQKPLLPPDNIRQIVGAKFSGSVVSSGINREITRYGRIPYAAHRQIASLRSRCSRRHDSPRVPPMTGQPDRDTHRGVRARLIVCKRTMPLGINWFAARRPSHAPSSESPANDNRT